MKRKHEFRPIVFPIGTAIPLQIPIYFSVGQCPLVRAFTLIGGVREESPLITPSFTDDLDGYVNNITLNPSSGSPFATTEEFWIYINPQDVK